MTLNDEITFFAETTFRNLRKRFGIRTDDRRRHMYVIGKTGMGKSEMLANMIIQDIQRGNGVAVVDPHGELAEKMLDYIPSERVNDVVYVNPSDIDFPIAFNVMESVDMEHRHLVASGMMGVFKKIWPDVWSARMEYILNNAILALLEYPGSTILGINRMLSDKEYRTKVVDKITDPVVKAFWITEFARYTQRLESEATASIQNKIGQFISNPLIRNIVGQVRSKIDMREVMDTKKILIVNLSKGRVGEDNSRLLGAMLVTKIQLAAMSRVDMPEEERKDFYLYVDEFQNFATDSFANILSEARKYRLALIMAHQYIAQIGTGDDTKVRDAVFGNVGTMVCFRVGAEDAEFLEKEFDPDFLMNDLVNLPKFQIYLKLMINGITNRGFSAATLPPFERPKESFRETIIKVSRERYGIPRASIEEKVGRWWSGMMAANAPKGEVPGLPGSMSAGEPPQLFEATCANCGKRTYVTFQPDGKRPVYCKKCLKQKQQELAARTAQMEGGQTISNQEREAPRMNQESSIEQMEQRVPMREPERFSRPSVPLMRPSSHEATTRQGPPSRGEIPIRRGEGPSLRPQFPENRFERERKVVVPSFQREDAPRVRESRPSSDMPELNRGGRATVTPPSIRRVPRQNSPDTFKMSASENRFRTVSADSFKEEGVSLPKPISLTAALSVPASTFKRVSDNKFNGNSGHSARVDEKRTKVSPDRVALRQTLKEVLGNRESYNPPQKTKFRTELGSGTGVEKQIEPTDESHKIEADVSAVAFFNEHQVIEEKHKEAESGSGSGLDRESSTASRLGSHAEEEKKEGMLNPGETLTV